MPNAGTSSVGSVRRFAVGKPSVPPRASPETTVPSTSTGRPSSAAAPRTSPAADELADLGRRDALDERRHARREPEPLEQRRGRRSGRGRSGTPRPRRRVSAPIAAQVRARRTPPAASAASSGVNSTTSVSSTPSSASSSSRRSSVDEQLDLVAEHLARMRVERDDRRQRPGLDRRARRPRGGRGGRRRRCRSRPRAAGARARPGCARPSRRPPTGLDRRARGARIALGHACERLGGKPCERLRDRQQPLRSRPPRPRTARPRCAAACAQCPPSAAAIERTYVPEPTCSSSVDASSLVASRARRARRPASGAAASRPPMPSPRQPVGALAADLHRRGGRDRQLDLAAEARRAARRARRPERRVPLDDLALRIAGRASSRSGRSR